MIIRKYVNIKDRSRCTELKSSLHSMTVPGQSFTVEELLRRSQNGTFPDINFYTDYDHPDMLPDDASEAAVSFDEVDDHDFIDHFDYGQVKEQVEILKPKVDRILKKNTKNNKSKK